jgi:hypothetical protein
VAELLGSISSAEFALWMAFHREGGFGEEQRRWSVAIGSAAVCQSMGSKVRPDQLMPKFGPKQPTPLPKLKSWINSLTPERFFR